MPGRVGDGRRVAQQAHHGDADTTIPYQGGPRFDSKIWILDSELASDATWAKHNGCEMSAGVTTLWFDCTFGTSPTNFTVGRAARHFYQCPETAPVEFWQVEGAPRGDAETFSIHYKDANHSKIEKVVDFFSRVERASTPPPPPPPPSITKRIEDWAHEELPYTTVTIVGAAICCACMCMGGLCSKGR